MNEDINELFGDLRSMLSSGSYDPRELFWLLDGAYEQDPTHYIDQWHHYLRAYSPLKMLITSTDELDKLPELLPPETHQDVALKMTGHHLRKWHFQEIADSDGSWFLSALDISDNRAKNHYPASFSHTETLINLRTLNMAQCDLHNIVAVWVLRAPFLATVEELNLANNPLELGDIEALAQNTHIQNIQRLNLSGCNVSSASLKALVKSPHLIALRHLDLSHNPLNSSDFLALAGWPLSAQLESLELPWARIDLKTRQHMVDSTFLCDAIKDNLFERTMPSTTKGKKKK